MAKFKSSILVTTEGQLENSSKPEPADRTEKVNEGEQPDGSSSLSIVLRRSECGICGSKGNLCVVTGSRSIRTVCRQCNKTNSNNKTNEIYTNTRLIEAVIEMAENKLPVAIAKPKQRKSARQEFMGTVAQRREEQMTEVWGRIEALESAQKIQQMEESRE